MKVRLRSCKVNRTPESVLTPDGRRVMWTWLVSTGSDAPLKEKSIQCLPRELSLHSDGVLRINPLREIEGQRSDYHLVDNVTIDDPVSAHRAPLPPISPSKLRRIAEVEGDSYELRIVIPRSEALRKLFGFALFADGAGGGLPIMLRPETGSIRVGNTEAPFSPFDLHEDEDVEIRIFVDRYLVEVFVNSRQAVVTAYMDYAGRPGIDAFTVGAPTKISRIETWKLTPTHQGFLEAQKNRIWEPERQ